ncbi:50S ribosomal protein LX [Pyrolobus fumarii 1A]|uniref:Large ribosomal subunit protein eL20 n=1 Tax=Pyrolobus fumarii (strain DSM 11204 / 1A) TaxID=694429 RepID=G0EEM9_PYRF1|nr:50S ribosomal protein L18Ae [Pyrolobus fumarii]AEM38851.1 50S ribosomal protein LX [Pyrolobus fumarii 1A]
MATSGDVQVKIFRVEGRMLIKHDKFPTWWKFRKEVRALTPEHAIEKVLSEMGSKHRVKRYNIVIESVKEISLDEATDRYVILLSQLKKWVKE